MLITVPAAVIPSLFLLWYFYAKDKYPEPPRVLFATFGLGILTVIPVVIVGQPVFFLAQRLDNPIFFGAVAGFVCAGIPEEFFKFVVIYYYCMRHSEFDEPMDGLVYGVAASLGFATLENILYVSAGGLIVAALRAVTAVPMHAALGAVMGYYCGQARFMPDKRRKLLFTAWFVPMLLHGFYDFPLFLVRKYVGVRLGGDFAGAGEFSMTDVTVVLGAIGTTILVLIIAVATAVLLARRLKKLQAQTVQSAAERDGYPPDVHLGRG